MVSDILDTMTTSTHNTLSLIRSVSPPTPLEAASQLDSPWTILLKREDRGHNNSFKWRGALAACMDFQAHGAAGVVTASTGNHGAAVGWAAHRLGMTAHVVVPNGANPIKCERIAATGATLHYAGEILTDAATHAQELSASLQLPYFEDGASTAQLAGTATIGDELAEVDATTIIIPVACGALAAGIAQSLHGRPHLPRLIGVQVAGFDRMARAFANPSVASPPPITDNATTIADGLADNRIVEPAFSLCRELLDDMVTVTDDDICAAIRELWERCGILVEGAAASTLAALRVYPDHVPPGRTVLILSGGNLAPDMATSILEGVTYE